MTAIILSGGKSSRMGKDKALVQIKGTAIIKKQAALLKKIFSTIIVVTNRPYNLKGVKTTPDIIPDCGPLGGIYSGLVASSSFYNFVVACDMPFLNKKLIRYLMKIKDKYDIVVPRLDRKFHPLFGLYSKKCLPIIEKALKKGKLKVSSIFAELRTRFVSEQEIKKFDENFLCLININTPQDYQIYVGKNKP